MFIRSIHLGDGVYLEKQEFSDVRIFLNDGLSSYHEIYLDPDVLLSLLREIARIAPELYMKPVTKDMLIEYT